jgi:hypothetical protein
MKSACGFYEDLTSFHYARHYCKGLGETRPLLGEPGPQGEAQGWASPQTPSIIIKKQNSFLDNLDHSKDILSFGLGLNRKFSRLHTQETCGLNK